MSKILPSFNKYPYPPCNLPSNEGYVSFPCELLIDVYPKEFVKVSFHNWLIINFDINFIYFLFVGVVGVVGGGEGGGGCFPSRKHHKLCFINVKI